MAAAASMPVDGSKRLPSTISNRLVNDDDRRQRGSIVTASYRVGEALFGHWLAFGQYEPKLGMICPTVDGHPLSLTCYTTDPSSMNPTSGMPPHPTFDDNTFNTLEPYF